MKTLFKVSLLALAISTSAQAQDVFTNVESFNQNELNLVISGLHDLSIYQDVSKWLQDPDTDNFITPNGDTFWFQAIPDKEFRATDELFMNCRKHKCTFEQISEGAEKARYNLLKENGGIAFGELLKK